jgi:predicted nucleotidyltransferase component of viral defense system
MGGNPLNLSRETLLEESSSLSFKADVFEKVIRLIDLLNAINTHEFLANKLVLKGGTALNLFVFDLPRLSIDIDLNYIGSIKLDDLNKDRPLVEQALSNLCKQKGYVIKRTPSDHAGGKWLLGYSSALGATANLQVDVNYLYRAALWPTNRYDSYKVGSYQAKNILVLDTYELAAGKLKALLSRTAARDLFDAMSLIQLRNIDRNKLRLALIIYGAMNPRDWSTVNLNSITFDVKEMKEKLLPVLRTNQIDVKQISDWGNQLVNQVHEFLTPFFPLRPNEVEFITTLRTKGQIEPTLLTSDSHLASIIKIHPALLWRAAKAKSDSTE